MLLVDCLVSDYQVPTVILLHFQSDMLVVDCLVSDYQRPTVYMHICKYTLDTVSAAVAALPYGT